MTLSTNSVTMENLTYDCMLATESNIEYIFMCLQANQEIAVDTETTGLDVHNGTDFLMGFCFSVEGMSCYMPFRHRTNNVSQFYLERVREILNEKDLIWHNRKFDMHSCATIGIDPLQFKGKQYCTMMITHMVDEELYSKELDYLAKRFLKLEKFDKDAVEAQAAIFGGRINLPVEAYENYGPVDAKLTRLLKNYIYPKLADSHQEHVYWDTEAPFTRLLYLLEQRGIGSNLPFAEEKASIGTNRMGTIKRELGGLNPSSPIELGQYLLTELELPILAHTDSCELCKMGMRVDTHEGKPSFNKLVMEEYDEILSESSNVSAKRISEFRGWQKAVSSLYLPVIKKTTPKGFIHTQFKQHGTVTMRLSSHDPNLQQIPRSSPKPWNGNAKSTFNSGYEDLALYGYDYSQLEFRLSAAYGDEKLLLAEFEKDDSDVFTLLTPNIFGEYSDELRHKTKNCFVYPTLYGAGLKKIALVIGKSQEDTKPLLNNYKKTIPGIIHVSEQVTDLVKRTGQVKYWDGSIRHIKNRTKAYKAWNSVIQGGAAQMVKKAMLRCEEFESEECKMVLQVHDEITFIINRSKQDYYEPLIKRAMTDWPQFGVHFAIEGKEWR